MKRTFDSKFISRVAMESLCGWKKISEIAEDFKPSHKTCTATIFKTGSGTKLGCRACDGQSMKKW